MTRMTLILLLGLPAVAQEAALQEVRVTATRMDRCLADVPHSVGVVTREQLKREGARSVADLLRDLPGVQVEDGSVPGQKRISIRGESSARVLLLIDGQKVSEQKSMSGAVFLLDPSQIERIEVVKGPASVLYGSEAIGGVVNLITRKGGQSAFEGDLGMTLDGATRGGGMDASLSGRAGHFAYRASSFRGRHGNRRTAEGEALNTGYEERGGRLVLEHRGPHMELAATLERHTSDLEVYTPAGAITSTIPWFFQDLPEWSRKKASLSGSWRGQGALARLSGHLFRQETAKDFWMEMDLKPTSTMTLQTRNRMINDLETTGAQLQSDWTLGDRHLLMAGLEWNRDALGADEIRRSRMLPMKPVFSESRFRDEAESTTRAVFLQDEWRPSGEATLTLGLRQTWVETALNATTNPLLRLARHQDSNLVGALGGTLQVSRHHAFRFSTSQGYRFPTLQQLYMGTVHGSSEPTFSNPDLRPETSRALEAGWRMQHPAARIDLALFQSVSRDYITTELAPTPTQPKARRYGNVDRARSRGFEANLSLPVAGGLEPHASLTWLRRTFESASLSTSRTGSPALQGSLGLRVTFRGGWEGGFSLRAATRAELESPTKATELHPGWATVNASGGWRKGRTAVHLNLENLLDRFYTTAFETVPKAGRSASLVIRTAF